MKQLSKQGSEPSKEITSRITTGARIGFDELASRVIESAIELHHDFGPRILESACPQGSGHEPSVGTKADCNAWQLELALRIQNKPVQLDEG
jgi:hypothetical protein